MSETIARKLRQFPEALQPIYTTPSPNTAISLFEGELLLTQSGKVVSSAPGSVKWHWLPRPAIRFESFWKKRMPDLSEAELSIPEIDLSCQVLVTSVRMENGTRSYSGHLITPVNTGGASECERVIFHLPNFTRFIGGTIRDPGSNRVWRGRLNLDSEQWRVILDENREARELIDALKDIGGFALTHTGAIERSDGSRFDTEEAGNLLTALFYFLSFLKGSWCGPILAVGQADGKNVWRQWKLPKTLTPWKSVETWFYSERPDELNSIRSAFHGFLTRWNDSLWGDPIRIAIHWYVESNLCAGGIEGSIILAQAALELLSWVYLVEDLKMFTERQFNNTKQYSAAEKIRLLLNKLQIPTHIPSNLSALNSVASGLGASDGPGAFVKLRNGITHPKKARRAAILQTPAQARVDAWQLGVWYVEMTLLYLLGYSGVYYQRFLSGHVSEAKALVPWAESV